MRNFLLWTIGLAPLCAAAAGLVRPQQVAKIAPNPSFGQRPLTVECYARTLVSEHAFARRSEQRELGPRCVVAVASGPDRFSKTWKKKTHYFQAMEKPVTEEQR